MPRPESAPSERLVLASASPRRSELLRAVGLAFDVAPAGIDERVAEGERAAVAAVRLAEQKARHAAARHPGRPVLGADTVVDAGGELLGKPADADEARAMLRALSGRWHEVVTGIALVVPGAGAATSCAVTRVKFAELSDDEIERYVRGGEPFGKAGAYAIQGAGGWFVEEIRGSASNVIGLPLDRVRLLLRTAGIRPALSRRPSAGHDSS